MCSKGALLTSGPSALGRFRTVQLRQKPAKSGLPLPFDLSVVRVIHYLQTAMDIRSALSAFLLLVPIVSTASEGMIYKAVYECQADEINRVMVEACSSRFPELANPGDEALPAWREPQLG